jgi:hypothetical protein
MADKGKTTPGDESPTEEQANEHVSRRGAVQQIALDGRRVAFGAGDRREGRLYYSLEYRFPSPPMSPFSCRWRAFPCPPASYRPGDCEIESTTSEVDLTWRAAM